MKKFFSDFKAFIAKGNIIDMAVGVVIGGAFGKIVTSLVNDIINPLISLLTGGVSLDGLKTVLTPAVAAVEAVTDEAGNVTVAAKEATAEVAILWGVWLQTIIDFLLVAFCIFLVLRVIMKANEKLHAKELAAKAEEEAKAKAEEEAKKAAEAEKETTEQILADIRALIKEGK